MHSKTIAMTQNIWSDKAIDDSSIPQYHWILSTPCQPIDWLRDEQGDLTNKSNIRQSKTYRLKDRVYWLGNLKILNLKQNYFPNKVGENDFQ